MNTIKELFEKPYLAKCFTFDISSLDVEKVVNSSKKPVSLKCVRCSETHEYEIRRLKETSFIKCSCKEQYKSFEKNLKAFGIQPTEVIQNQPEISETIEEQPKLDITTTIPFRFYKQDNYFMNPCCGILYPLEVIHLIKKCPIHDTLKPNRPIYIQKNPVKHLINYQIELNDELLRETEAYRFKVIAQLISEYNEQEYNITDCIENLKTTYDKKIARMIDNLYRQYNLVSWRHLQEYISENPELNELLTEYNDTTKAINQYNMRISTYRKLLDIPDLKERDVYYCIKNIDSLDISFYISKSIDSYIKYQAKNKEYQLLENLKDKAETIKALCTKCKTEFYCTQPTFKLMLNSIHSCQVCHPNPNKEEPARYKKTEYPFYSFNYIKYGKN